jgi:hypothetical protein
MDTGGSFFVGKAVILITCFSNDLTNSLVEKPEGSTQLIPKSATGHDPEPVPSISHPHSLFP